MYTKTLLMLTIFVFFPSLVFPLTKEQREHEEGLTEIANSRCDTEQTEGRDYEVKVLANGNVQVSLLGKKGGGIDGTFEYTKSEWEGRQRVLREHQANENSDRRKCIKDELESLRISYKPPTTPEPKPEETEFHKTAENWHNCGAGRLPGDSIVDARVMSVHDKSIYIEVDYAFNSRHLSEKPISINAYLLGLVDGKEIGLGGGTNYKEVTETVGSVSFQVEVSNNRSPVTSHDLFVYMTGIYIPEGRPRTQTAPFVCKRFPFKYAWQ